MDSQMKSINKVWEDPEPRNFWPNGVRVCHPPSVDVFTNQEAHQTPYYWVFAEASSSRHDQILTSFLTPLLSLRMEGGAENSRLLIVA